MKKALAFFSVLLILFSLSIEKIENLNRKEILK